MASLYEHLSAGILLSIFYLDRITSFHSVIPQTCLGNQSSRATRDWPFYFTACASKLDAHSNKKPTTSW